MVYRALTEYLLHRAPRPPIRGWMVFGAIALIMATMVWAPYPWALVSVSTLAIVGLVLVHAWLTARQRAEVAETGQLGARDWLFTLARFARERQLESRSHPKLIEDFESCARLRQDILQALQSSEWDTLSLKPGWKEVRDQCQASAESLFEDALWASKGAFRPLGGRRETFAKRCEDPDFASAALGGVRLARTRLAKLLDEVHDDPFAGQGTRDALSRALAEIHAIREAEAELRTIQINDL